MKILFPIGAFYPSQVGGPCNTLYWHTCELYKKGLDISIVTTNKGIQDGVVRVDESIKERCGTIFYGKGSGNNFRIAKKAIQETNKADLIHLNSFFDLISISTFFYSQLFYPEKKFIFSVRGQMNPAALNYSSWKKRPLLILYKFFSNKIVFHTTSKQETMDTIRVFGKNKIFELPNYIQPAKKLNKSIKKQLLFVGRIHPIKGLHHLIRALSCSSFVEKDFKLILAGKHELRHQYYLDELKELILELNLKDRVEFCGHISGLQKEELYASSTALILPSESENFGNVVVEALNQGTPVIASKGTPWEILEKYKCGYHVENSPKDLGEAISKIIESDDASYSLMRKQSQRLVMEEFNISQKIDSWICIYHNLNHNN